jgi:hypothetical protein
MFASSVSAEDLTVCASGCNSTTIQGAIDIASNVDVTLTATVSKSGHESTQISSISVTVAQGAESDEQAVVDAKDVLTYEVLLLNTANSDKNNITKNINLSKKGLNKATIGWLSNNPTVISSTGIVSRPFTTTNTTVTLTATISRGDVSNSSQFTFIVPGTQDSDEDAVAKGKIALTDSVILNGNADKDSILSDVYLPSIVNNVNIIWDSTDNSTVNSTDGAVTRPEVDTEVTITAILTSNAITGTKTFLLTVKQRPAVADAGGKVEVSTDDTEIMIDTSNADSISSISVPSTVAEDEIVTLNLKALKTGNNITLGSNVLNLSRATDTVTYDVVIPAGTVISGSDTWNGLISLPAIKAISEVTATATSGFTVSTDKVIEVGATTPLNFTKAVTLTIPGMASSKAGYTDADGIFHTIPSCTVDQANDPSSELPVAGDCYTTSGSDLIIYTKHFTKFAAYTETAIPEAPPEENGGGGGGGGSYVRPKPVEEVEEVVEEIVEEPEEVEEDELDIVEEAEIVQETEEQISGLSAITGQVVSVLTSETTKKSVGPLVVLLIVIGGLVGYLKLHGGAPGADNFTRAANMHKRAEQYYRKGDPEKAEKLYKKAQIIREQGERRFER